MSTENTNFTTTRLLTLLNVSAVKAGKRKRPYDVVAPVKLNKKRSTVKFAAQEKSVHEIPADDDESMLDGAKEPEKEEAEEEEQDTLGVDLYERHYGPLSADLTEGARSAIDKGDWKVTRLQRGKLGQVVECQPDGASGSASGSQPTIIERLKVPFETRQRKLPPEHRELQNDLLSALGSNQDLFLTPTSLNTQKPTREAITLHALNHAAKKRRRVLKSNERIAHASKSGQPAPEDSSIQDQGFTRPSVLILTPFRAHALAWVDALTAHTPSPAYQIENHARFVNEFGLPAGAVDKLAEAEPGMYPPDHVDMFRGNVDDSFRIGIKLTRKTVKLFAEFYESDVIIASPLGLRMSIEKEKSADFLSSIEILIVDKMDALAMQNWEHVQFLFSNLNKMPKESHDADFSRIKPWYLDGHAAYLRQTILLSAYETPEMRSLYNTSLRNVAGKVRTERRWNAVDVPEGIEQKFVQFDCASPKDEADKRFQHFTTQLLPLLQKSAVQSTNALVFVPSSFDFIRVHNHFRKEVGASFVVLSEYSTNQDISRARQAFFTGSAAFLLVSERFHFFRRYKIRGIRNLVFYGPPDHAQFYTELLSYPFLDEGVEPADVTVRVLCCRYDWMKLERIAGTEGALGLVGADGL